MKRINMNKLKLFLVVSIVANGLHGMNATKLLIPSKRFLDLSKYPNILHVVNKNKFGTEIIEIEDSTSKDGSSFYIGQELRWNIGDNKLNASSQLRAFYLRKETKELVDMLLEDALPNLHPGNILFNVSKDAAILAAALEYRMGKLGNKTQEDLHRALEYCEEVALFSKDKEIVSVARLTYGSLYADGLIEDASKGELEKANRLLWFVSLDSKYKAAAERNLQTLKDKKHPIKAFFSKWFR